MLSKVKLALSITFIVLASFTIFTYDRQNMFIIQATGSGPDQRESKLIGLCPLIIIILISYIIIYYFIIKLLND
jgi:uncharacterized membrane protein